MRAALNSLVPFSARVAGRRVRRRLTPKALGTQWSMVLDRVVPARRRSTRQHRADIGDYKRVVREIAAVGEVLSGPFTGMHFGPEASWGHTAPYVLGSYECELHELIERFATTGYARVVDVGCAEGYYAVGFARRLPGAEVFAFDIDAGARRICARTAELNGVGDRVHVAGECTPEILEGVIEPGTLVFVDCEGAEVDLLDPARTPSLATTDLLVELHDFVDPTITDRLVARFEPTHEIVLIDVAPRHPEAYFALSGERPEVADRVVHEGRPVDPHPMQWAMMTALARIF